MSSFTMDAAPRFAAGSTVQVYPEDAFVNGSGPTSSAVTSAVVGSTGSVTFTGLTDDTRYVAAQLQSGAWRLTRFKVATPDRALHEIDTTLRTVESKVGLGVLPGTTSGTNVQTAITTLGAAGGRIILAPGAHTWDSIPALPANLTGSLDIFCLPGVTITLTTAGKRLFDFAKIADYDTFRRITLDGNGATVDCNGIAASGTPLGDHVIVGTIQSGTALHRVNFDTITIRRWRTINVPLGTSGPRRFNIALHTYHNTLGEATQTTCKRILVEDCDLGGGDYGVLIGGSYDAGGAGEVNHYLDDIVIRRVKHDMGVTPTAFYANANFHIASRAQGGKVTISDCEGVNSADIGIEVDGMQTAVVERCRTQDSFTGGVLFTNFQAAPYPESQTMTCRDHHHQVVSLTPTTTGPSTGYTVGATSAPTMGHAIFEGCKVTDRSTTMVVSGSGVIAQNSGFKKITIRDFTYVKDAVNSNVTVAANPVVFRINSTTVNGLLVMENIRVKIAGTLNAGSSAATLLRVYRLGGTSTKLVVDLHRLYFDVDVTNLTVSGGGLYGIDLGEPTASVMSGRISRVVVEAMTATPLGVIVVRDTTLTITPYIEIADCDFSGMTAGNDEVYFTNATQRAKIRLRGNQWRSTSSNLLNIASAAVVSLPDTDQLITITGATNITSAFGMLAGAVVRLKFSSTPTVSSGAGQKLSGGVNFVATADDLLTVASDGSTVYEVGRSVNA